MNVAHVNPVYGDTYAMGDIGFTFVGDSMSQAIAYFERWNRSGDIKVSHALVVTGPGQCVEAHIENGVARAPLDKYFSNPHTQTFFRRVYDWTPALGAHIAVAAESKIGCKYDAQLIIADLAADSVFGHWLNKLFGDKPERFFAWLAGKKNEFICSQLAAYALAAQPEFRGVGCLSRPLNTIDPQLLFEDEELFEPWVRAVCSSPQLQQS